ncbi:MAG TPA: RDD family protein [Steroidobacteraceae bacterium]|nr:RDD family protein [Steroidobacteraceae bacterium]
MKYPNVLRRYLATALDLFAWWCLIYAMSGVPAITEHSTLAYSLFVVSLLLYEPLLTTYACTLGQAIMRIRVRTLETLQRVSLDQAFGRMVVKYLLGVISFLTVPARADRRAIHDLASNTIVISA